MISRETAPVQVREAVEFAQVRCTHHVCRRLPSRGSVDMQALYNSHSVDELARPDFVQLLPSHYMS